MFAFKNASRGVCLGVVGLATLGLAWVVAGTNRIGLKADQIPTERGRPRSGVAEAHALVDVLEARARAVAAQLKVARSLLAELEGENSVAPKSSWRSPGEASSVDGPGRAKSDDPKIPGASPDDALTITIRDKAKKSSKSDPLPGRSQPGDQTGEVEGIWRIAGIGGHESGTFVKPPYDEYKIVSAGHYLWLSFRPENGDVLRSGGGTFSIKDGVYTARVDFSNSSDLRAVAGQEYTGQYKREDKKWYHFGKMTHGATFDELWERVH